jgi:hypothetical protein
MMASYIRVVSIAWKSIVRSIMRYIYAPKASLLFMIQTLLIIKNFEEGSLVPWKRGLLVTPWFPKFDKIYIRDTLGIFLKKC